MRLIVEVLNLNDARPTPFPQIVEGNAGVLEQTEIDSRDPQTFGVARHSGRRISVEIQRLQQFTKSRSSSSDALSQDARSGEMSVA